MTTEAEPQTRTIRCCGLDIGHLDEIIGPGAQEELSRLAAAFKALSDETRLRILRTMLHSREMLCECEIVPLFGLSQPTISYHLKVLREAGIVEGERRGQWVYYRVSAKALLGIVRGLTEIA